MIFMSTRILNSSKYVDLIYAGRKVMLCTTWLPRKDIKPLVESVDRIVLGRKRKESSVLGRGILGTMVAGVAGTIMGVATAKDEEIVKYVIHLKPGFEMDHIELQTDEPGLIKWLESYC